jgi:hypothetical protein
MPVGHFAEKFAESATLPWHFKQNFQQMCGATVK